MSQEQVSHPHRSSKYTPEQALLEVVMCQHFSGHSY